MFIVHIELDHKSIVNLFGRLPNGHVIVIRYAVAIVMVSLVASVTKDIRMMKKIVNACNDVTQNGFVVVYMGA